MLSPSRLFRLAPLLFLFVFSLLASAQTPPVETTPSSPTSPSKDTVLFDFEGGNFEGWTLSGDCWDKNPSTSRTFVDRQGNPLVTGIVGEGYLTTLYKSAATTGKAVSKEFTIDRPFLTFKIGGGHYPQEACLNLIVEGRIVRTETGNDLAILEPKSWDVSLLKGKTAHLEIMDSTANPNRGYVMVDEIVLTMKSGLSSSPLPETEPMLDVPLRIIHILDAQGEAELADNSHAVLTLSAAKRQIAAVNELFRPARIQFTLASNDFEIRKDDYLNLDFDAPALDVITSLRSAKPIEVGKRERLRAFQRIADEQRGKLTIFVHRGSEWQWNTKAQKWEFTTGFSHGQFSNRRASFATMTNHVARVWAHELAHTFRLPHTSKDGVDNPSNLVTEAQIGAACEEYLAKGGDQNHPEYAIDGDYQLGIKDTPPDPGLGFWGNSRDLTRVIQLRLSGRKPFPLLVSRNNIMGAIANFGGFSPDQIGVMRRRIELWKSELTNKQ